MNGIIKRGLLTVLVTGGFLALGAGVAYADDVTDGSNGTASGSQAVLGINLPITIGGNGISVLGDSSSSGASNTGGTGGSSPSAWTSGTNALAGGTQGVVDANVPVTIGGNAISVLGDSSSEHEQPRRRLARRVIPQCLTRSVERKHQCRTGLDHEPGVDLRLQAGRCLCRARWAHQELLV